MKEQIIKIIESKAQGKYHLEIDESDLEIIANEILDLFSVSKQRELLESFVDYAKGRSIRDINIDDDTILYFLEDSNCG